MPDITREDVLNYLKQEAPDIAALVGKDLTVGDVHQPTALGNVSQAPKTPEVEIDEDDDQVLPRVQAKSFKELIENSGAWVDYGKEMKPGDDGFLIPLKVLKAAPDQQMIFGWASVVEKDGKLIIDKQDDMIEPEDLEKAAYDFVLYSRQQGDMHVRKGTGRLIESMVFTKEKQSVLGIDLGLVGWWVGFKVDDPDLWAAHKRGERPEFSIGGRGKRVDA